MEITDKETIISLFNKQKNWNAANKHDYNDRIDRLKRLKSGVIKYEQRIKDALWTDLHKSPEESYLTEIYLIIKEIDYHIKHLKRWMKPMRVKTPFYMFPSNSVIEYEPLGTSLIIAPWNYPFQLLINPLVGALSSGCTAILKPSPYVPKVSEIIQEMITEYFRSEEVAVCQGGRDVNQSLFKLSFDIIFFTGSPMLGKTVMRAAAENLTPVVLELGGKSPCIVDKDADINIAARRIAWGKTVNAGQTCIAPDYLLAHQEIKDRLISRIAENIEEMFGSDIKSNQYYPRIVNEKAMNRLQTLMKHGNIYSGGEVSLEERYITPTIIDGSEPQHPIMQEEIFGPILPVMTFTERAEVISYVNGHEKPLALYYFGDKKNGKDLMSQIPFGGGCINDTVMHIANHNLPFGGVGNSGLGKYHGRESFKAFSNAKSILITPVFMDLPFRYPPFRSFDFIKKFF
ncbi:MAG: aldehyde dehydrogenase family protein [Spirochaetales bacterium]|uniref:Aldehyde dehydrogenase n=1 Tax=Candidatus Thalassospirochaeta sargassi TaxID=3119039 RepID=A0AAJ1IFM9_9SPIO|nr:aldehyde dehydrogenase family protein [Spirochaetales bacterium]